MDWNRQEETVSKKRFVQILVISAMAIVPVFTAFPAQAISDTRQEASRAEEPSAV